MGHCKPECSMGSGRRAVCAQCLHDNGSCHICTPTPKRAGRLVPPVPEKPKLPINWYFNEPVDKPWVVRTRDTALDPQLLLIKEVIKTHDLSTAKSRSARPHGWERSLVAECVLADPFGGELEASIRWPALLENATWAQNEVVLCVQDWLPGNLRFVGKVLTLRPQMAYTPPAPSTPDWIINSSVQIEDVSKDDEEEGLREEDRLEIQAEINRVKRMRLSD